MEELLERFNSSEVIEFNNLMKESTCKLETVVTFLALLELIKIRTIQVFQDESFSNILIKRSSRKHNSFVCAIDTWTSTNEGYR